MSLAVSAHNLRATLSTDTKGAVVAPANPVSQDLRCLIIIPAFNEAGNISKVIDRLRRSLPEMDVLVVDDGSTDGTARSAAARTKTITLPFNVGIGGALQTGFRYAARNGYDIAVQVDGDGQHRPCEVRKLVQTVASGQADFAVGSRYLSQNGYRQTRSRLIGAAILRSLIRLLTGRDITDCTSGFRAANARIIRAFAHWYPEDFLDSPEVILLLHRSGYKVEEVPVSMRQRRTGSSTVSDIRGVFYVAKVSLCLLLDMARHPWDNDKVKG